MTTTTLPDLTEIPPVGDEDRACLSELRDVLRAHEALGRFGVVLLHDHFVVLEGEMLVETCDEASRTLTIRPLPVGPDPAEGRFIETSWRFSPDGEGSDLTTMLKCKVGCFVDLKDRHRRTHDRVW